MSVCFSNLNGLNDSVSKRYPVDLAVSLAYTPLIKKTINGSPIQAKSAHGCEEQQW